MSACSGGFYGAPAPVTEHSLPPPDRSAGRGLGQRRARAAVFGGRRRMSDPLALQASTEDLGVEATTGRPLNAAGRVAAERAGPGSGRALAVRTGTTRPERTASRAGTAARAETERTA